VTIRQDTMRELQEKEKFADLLRAARDVLDLEYPRPGMEDQHPAFAMNGPRKWQRLRETVERLERR
jgi:hypothetical protein